MKRSVLSHSVSWILCFFIFFSGCQQGKHSGRGNADADHVFRILALGDSYTIGERVHPDLRWPVQLTQSLRELEFKVEDPVIVARTGWTTDELAAGIEAENIEDSFDIVTLLIGVNNQYRGRSIEQYRHEFRALLIRAIQFTGGASDRLFVLSIPDWGATPFAKDRDTESIAREIDAFNTVNLEETKKENARYVDVTHISRRVVEDTRLIADDGLHPSGQMYKMWVDTVLPQVVDIFNKEPVSNSVRNTPGVFN